DKKSTLGLFFGQVFSVDNEDPTGASLDFLLPRDLSDGFVNNKRESYKFRFKKVFDQHAKQEDIFENIARPVADSVLAGFNGAIFAYGQTGSGKTFTITGGAERYADRGIIPRTLSYLFERFSQDSSTVYTMHISYLEIYNELGYDLLDPRHEASRLEDLPKVLIMEDADQNIHLRNLSLQQAANEEEALNLLFLGDTNRMIAETPLNQASTRSHCIFTVHLCRREPGSATLQRSKLHLVDLAGSDRVSKTGLNGVLLTEAKYINLSLHFLEQVILALSERSRSHIPYRNSMLTSVLRDSLGGNCMTTMIATLAVDKRNLDESISTCRFAQRVALIKNEAILNEELDPVLLIAHLKEEILTLKKQLATMMGEQKDEQLTADEMLKLEELIEAFLNDPDPDGTLSLGPAMRKVQHSFSYFKVRVFSKPQLTAVISKHNAVIIVRTQQSAHAAFAVPGSQLSAGKQEAFEIFIKDHEEQQIIEDHKQLIKKRSAEARTLSEQLNQVRNTIGKFLSFSTFYDQLGKSDAQGFPEVDLVLLMSCVSYKSAIGRLKALSTEIEHLQLLLERVKVKIQKDFQKWWTQEASTRLSCGLGALTPGSPMPLGAGRAPAGGPSLHLAGWVSGPLLPPSRAAWVPMPGDPPPSPGLAGGDLVPLINTRFYLAACMYLHPHMHTAPCLLHPSSHNTQCIDGQIFSAHLRVRISPLM
uniref:Kinesin family member 6 n=1 Tax=Oryzias sinensis TaxID=183150 RepID=A0A8C8A2Y9_9TELE